MFIKKIVFFAFSLTLIFGVFSFSRASFGYASNNRYQPTIILSGDIDANSSFMAGWGSKIRHAIRKVVDAVKKITVDVPVDSTKKSLEVTKDLTDKSLENAKDITIDKPKDLMDGNNNSKDKPKPKPEKDKSGTGGGSDGGDETNPNLNEDGSLKDPCRDLSGKTLDLCKSLNSDDTSNPLPNSDSTNPPPGVDFPTNEDSPLTNPFDDLNKKMEDMKSQILKSFSLFGEAKQERISKLTVLVGEKRAGDIDLGIQNIAGKFSNLLSRIIDFNSNITRGSKNLFANKPNPATEKDVVLKLRFAFEQIKNSNSLIDHLRETYLDIINADSEEDLQIRYEKNLKPLFIQTSDSIKNTYFYIEKIAKMMREISKS